MFIGHDACSFAAKRVAPRMSLGWLIAAPNLLDLLWPLFLLLGIEHVRIQQGPTPFLNLDFYDYPWSHIALWSFVIFLIVVYIASLLGPPPPNERIIAWSALLLWLLPFWGAWIDRHREARA